VAALGINSNLGNHLTTPYRYSVFSENALTARSTNVLLTSTLFMVYRKNAQLFRRYGRPIAGHVNTALQPFRPGIESNV